ncbi:hypothetical protein [Burkholderia thailandensis]|uniref:hypothetical protein n=1 Tax=Burkholderia thailandensis TaxID=57975 RepID=UPI0003ECAF26|nr:hypothetical protein [Burkholderia thailandensis]AHI67569.1 hypothetical protein BTL_3642 [Burkholderia thailandensis H0587]AOJ53476.1 hypothetical protein AQ475_21720 [Burkholderia thailandensis]AVR28397.1 hypothetical protein A8H32_26250 [Burkholderia thailandensis]MCZ2896892.1 hypothetical protein [Burkholderia thailandensis]MCZ2901847.1 hypothetical protein [Burkholderia thailandensis]
MKLNGTTAAQSQHRHRAIERQTPGKDDGRRAAGVADEREGRTMKGEIKAIRMDVLKEIRFNSAVSTPVLLAKRNRIAANIREVSEKIGRKGLFGKMFEALKCVAQRGLYHDRRALRKLDAFVVLHIGDRPEDRRFKVLPAQLRRPAP